MSTAPVLPRSSRLLACLPGMALILLGCDALAASRAAAGPGDDPGALVAWLGELEQQERFGEVVEWILPDQREVYVFISWFGAAYDAIGAEPEVVEDYRAIVSAHGLDEAWLSEDARGRGGVRRVAEQALRGVDLAALLDDLAAFRKRHGRFGVAFGFVGELRELHVEQDWAQARIDETELELQRTEGGWTWCPFADLDD